MRICGMFGHKVRGRDGKTYLNVDSAKEFDFKNPEKYLAENGEMSIKLEGRKRTVGHDDVTK
ncbi:MAG: hypothetical protein IJ223_00935 [Clostridia bacterium]|nr:hypothetical protein [Clostridia bacterium]